MILRKPYAFLIKHFKAINLILLISVLFLTSRILSLYSFIKDYISTQVYNVSLTPVSNFINGYLYLALFLTLIISVVLFYLLKRKDKPVIAYVYIIVVMITTIALSLYVNNFFNNIETYNSQMTLLIRDLVLIDSLFYYPIIFILIIRSLGIDLKNFGFQQDKEFIELTEEDSEEVEVEVGFDKEKYSRIIKNKIRHAKYFYFEHKLVLTGIFAIVVLFGIFNLYNYYFVENRIYKQKEKFQSNYYQISINNTYLTDKDYAGNVISSENRFFIVLDVTIKNLAVSREFDASKLFLYVDNKYYIPTTRFNNSFKDLGTPFEKNKMIYNMEQKNYIVIYEVDKPTEKSNFLVKYQDLTSKDNKLIRVKIKVLDITNFKQRDIETLNNEITIPIYDDNKITFNISKYEITNSKEYTYESCYLYNCPIYEGVVNASNNKTLLYLKFDSDVPATEYLSFLKKYGKVKYTVDGKEYMEKISFKINKYRGSHAYIEVNNNINNASRVELLFTIRTNQYRYVLKEG